MPILRGSLEPIARKNTSWLILIAATSLALYIWLAARYSISSSLSQPRASWATLVTPNSQSVALHLGIYLCLTLLYLAAMRLLSSARDEASEFFRYQIGLIIFSWLAFSCALLFVAPAGESHDIFDYLFRGRMMTEYQANPLAEVPDSFGLSMPFTRYIAWRKSVDTYGPIWEVSSAAIATGVREVSSRLGWWDETAANCPASRESCRLLILYITGYRLMAVCLVGLSGWLVASITRRYQPALVPLALAAWLWNPLTLIAAGVGAHNDIHMIVLALLSWWLLQRQHPFWALLVLIMAAHVKLTALIWLPACGLWITWRNGWQRAIKSILAAAAIGLAMSWLLYTPFGGWQTLPRMFHERTAYLANSTWQVVKYQLSDWLGWSTGTAQQFSVGLSNGLAAVAILVIPLWVFNFRPERWRKPPTPDREANTKLWQALTAVSLIYLLVGSFWFQHWYILWLLAPAVLLPKSLMTRFILPWLCLGALCANAVMDFLSVSQLRELPTVQESMITLAIIWGPMLIVSLLRAVGQRLLRREVVVP